MKTRITLMIAAAMAGNVAALAQTPTDDAPVPALASPSSVEFTPMTRSERLRHYLTSTAGLSAIGHAALRAEIGQFTKNPKEWGRDPAGYSSRLGSALAYHGVHTTLEYGASSLLHEDNRYLPLRRNGFWRRMKYAVTSSFLARHDNGRRSFSFSGVGSAAGAAFISRAWLPQSVATVGAGAGSFGITIGASVGVNVFREFWPDLKRKLRRN